MSQAEPVAAESPVPVPQAVERPAALPPAPPVAQPRRERAGLAAALELVHDLAVALLLCVFLVTFVGQVFRVDGISMQPLLSDGERILVNKLAYRLGPVERGDVVVFHYPRHPATSYIKRVIGLPGDVVELRGGTVFVNGRELSEGYLAPAFRDHDNQPPLMVEQGYYYVLGDHRAKSRDSRSWGLVPERYIYGRAALRFWPPERAGGLH